MTKISPRIARYRARQLIQSLMKGGYMLDDREYNLLIKKKIFTLKEIRKYRRSLKIACNHWQYDASPLREMREYLRAGIPAGLIYQYAGVLARQHPYFEIHEFYEEKIRGEMAPKAEMEEMYEGIVNDFERSVKEAAPLVPGTEPALLPGDRIGQASSLENR